MRRPARRKGAGAEIFSYGEPDQALERRVVWRDIVLTNVVKREYGLAPAVQSGVGPTIVDSETELDLLDRIAFDDGKVSDIGIQLRPTIAGFPFEVAREPCDAEHFEGPDRHIYTIVTYGYMSMWYY